MKIHDTQHENGSRSILIRTTCGYEILVMRTLDKTLKIGCFFNNNPISLCNTHYAMSQEGALEFADAIKDIFNG